MRSFVDLESTFGNQPRTLGAELARIDTLNALRDQGKIRSRGTGAGARWLVDGRQ